MSRAFRVRVCTLLRNGPQAVPIESERRPPRFRASRRRGVSAGNLLCRNGAFRSGRDHGRRRRDYGRSGFSRRICGRHCRGGAARFECGDWSGLEDGRFAAGPIAERLTPTGGRAEAMEQQRKEHERNGDACAFPEDAPPGLVGSGGTLRRQAKAPERAFGELQPSGHETKERDDAGTAQALSSSTSSTSSSR